MGNIVAIVGRPNVGKSTLFNRLTQSRQAIVNEEAGTTRDRQYGKVDWTGKEFSLVDTGGWVINSDDVFEEEINKQVQVALDEADVILFVVDVLNGITDLDIEVAKILRRNKKPVIVLADKAETTLRCMPRLPNFIRSVWAILSVCRLSTVPIPATCWIRSSRSFRKKKMKNWKKSCPVLPLSVVRMPENRL